MEAKLSPGALKAALSYAKRGWRVLPLQPRAKHPLASLVPHGVKDATCDVERIAAWWGRCPNANIGVATGSASGIIVVDIDGEAGERSLMRLGDGPLPPTLTAQTGRGRHLYFSLRNGEHVACARLAPGLDLKGEGGYVCAAPSIHPSGKRYRFAPGAASPAPLLAWLLRNGEAERKAPAHPAPDLAALPLPQWAKKLIREGVPKGERSDELWRVLRSCVKRGISREVIVSMLMDPANGLSEKPREKGEAWLRAEITRAGKKPDTGQQRARREGLGSVCMQGIAPSEISWLWWPYLAQGKVTALAGDPGIGKSALATWLASALSAGRALPGQAKAHPPINVLMLSAEDGLSDTLKPRLNAMDADQAHVFASEKAFTLDEEGAAMLEAEIEARAASLAEIDPLVAYIGAQLDMHRQNAVRAIMAKLAEIAERRRCAILVIVHLAKAERPKAAHKVLGSVDFVAGARSVLIAAEHPEGNSTCVLTHAKCNIGPIGESRRYAFDGTRLSWLGTSPLTADELVGTVPDSDVPGALEQAKDFLRQMLADGPVPSTEIDREARAQHITVRTLKRAKSALGVRARKVGKPWLCSLSELNQGGQA